MVITWVREERAGLCASSALVVEVVVVEEVDLMKRRERRRRACSRGSIRIFMPVIIKKLTGFLHELRAKLCKRFSQFCADNDSY